MKKTLAIVCIFLFIITISLAVSPLYAANAKVLSGKDDKLKDEIDALKKEIQDLRKDVEDLKSKAVAAKPAPPPPVPQEEPDATVSMDDAPALGNSDAPVVIIEFSDYQCPFCKRFYNNTFPDLEREYIKTGKVKYLFRDFPLDFHNMAKKAAEAAHCAGEQGKYWDMHDKIFRNQPEIKVENLKTYASDIGINTDSFNSCLDSGKYAGKVDTALDDARKVAVSGTPTFFIGRAPLNGTEVSGKRMVGARPYSSFKPIIDQLLGEKR